MTRLVSLALACTLAFAAPAFAAGGGSDGGGSSGGSSGGGNGSPTAQQCKKGEVWSASKKKCVKAESGILTDEDLYQQGRALAKEAHYDWAIEVLSAIQDQEDPRVLNYLGYANRKAGRLDIGITYYQKALAIDPNFNLAREYLGEGYLAAGRVDLAMAQLEAIGKSCGTSCEEYQDLQAAIKAVQ